MAQTVKCLPAMRETQVRSLGREDPLEKEMATHSSILAWRILWIEEPGRLQSTGSQRVGATSDTLEVWKTGSSFASPYRQTVLRSSPTSEVSELPERGVRSSLKAAGVCGLACEINRRVCAAEFQKCV